jgi:hypothetical protein
LDATIYPKIGLKGKNRKPLNELLQNVDKTKPVIMMDHQPFNLEEAFDNGIDIQLSGHTHNGQLWPINYIVEKIYELPWGLKETDIPVIMFPAELRDGAACANREPPRICKNKIALCSIKKLFQQQHFFCLIKISARYPVKNIHPKRVESDEW